VVHPLEINFKTCWTRAGHVLADETWPAQSRANYWQLTWKLVVFPSISLGSEAVTLMVAIPELVHATVRMFDESETEQVAPAVLLHDSASYLVPEYRVMFDLLPVLMVCTAMDPQFTVVDATGASSDGSAVMMTPLAGVGLRHQYLTTDWESKTPQAT